MCFQVENQIYLYYFVTLFRHCLNNLGVQLAMGIHKIVTYCILCKLCMGCARYALGNFMYKICTRYVQGCTRYAQDWTLLYVVSVQYSICTVYKICARSTSSANGQDMRKICARFYFCQILDHYQILLFSVLLKLYSKNDKKRSRNNINFSIELPRVLTFIFITSFVKVQDLTSLVKV